VYLVQGQPLEISLAKIRSSLPLSAHFPGAHLTGDMSLMGPCFFFEDFLFIGIVRVIGSVEIDPVLWIQNFKQDPDPDPETIIPG
jgi:hypothetical protein